MIVRIIDIENFIMRMAVYGPDDYFKDDYNVLAIRKWHRKWQFLIDDGDRLHWWDADLFEVIDDKTSLDWVEIRYKGFHKFKNRKYDFLISISYYHGPKAFIENEDFLFDIIEEPKEAYNFYKSVLNNEV